MQVLQLLIYPRFLVVFFLLFSFLKSAPVILSRGGATRASFFCFGLYFFLPFGFGITTSPYLPTKLLTFYL
mgnify:CR=1 FL=1